MGPSHVEVLTLKIIYYDSGLVDLEAPIAMTKDQREKFIEFFEKTLENISIRRVEEPRKKMGSRESTMRSWTIEERAQLLSPASNEELASSLKRTKMAIVMQRGGFVPNFVSWCKKNKHELPEGNDLLKLIEYYEASK